MALRRIVFCVLLAVTYVAQAQAQAPTPLPAPQSERIIVKLRPALAQEAEAEFPAAMPPRQMHIPAGQARNARVQNFIGRYAARQLSPMYPEIVQLKKKHGWSDAQFAEHIRQRFAARARRHPHPVALPELSRTYILEFGAISADQKAQAVQRLKADPDIEFAEPEHTYSSKLVTNDPFLSTSGSWGQPYPDLWGLFAIGAPAAWDTATGDGIVVAVVDTGIDYNHPDLAANVWTNPNEIDGNFFDDDGNGFIDDVRGWNFFFGDNDPIDHNGHGTHVAGTIAAVGDNGIGIIGVAWHARVMAVKGLDDNGFGFDFTLAPAIMYAASNGADVINASWGGQGTSESIEEAIQFATGLGVVFVAAAGNSSEDAMNFFPANSPEAITVAASDPFGNFAFFSNFGPKIDVTAPGVDILSLQAAFTFLGPQVADGYIRLDGTSMAAPHVAGVAALSLSQNPAYSTEQVRQVIRSSATPVDFDSRFGAGRLNAAAAVAVTNPLEARITGLQFPGGPGGPITINGFAQGAGFSNYVLEYGFGTQPFFFNQFFSSVTPVSGTLGILDPVSLGLFDGTYTIRLTAFNTNGAGFTDRTQFTLVLVAITSPVPTSTFKPGFQLPIVGTATMPGFSNFTVQWSRQDGVGGLQNTGITLTGDGLSPLAGSTLATWDTSSITQAGYYNIVLTVNGGTFEQASTTVYLEPDLLSIGWPVFVDLGPYFNSGVVPARNADGTTRLVMESPNQGTTLAASWVFNLDGSFQKTNLDQFGSFHQPSVGNIDGLPGDEAVMPDFNVIRVIHPDSSFDILNPGIDVDFTKNPLLLEDLNSDFNLETIVIGNNYPTNTAYVYAWQPNGQQAPGFPIQVQDQNDLKNWFNHTRIMAGDFDGDGAKEIMVQEGLTQADYALRLFNHDGTPKTFNAPVLTGIPFAMVAADLDHNGKLETILVNYNGPQVLLHVFQPDGTERPGWPIDVSLSNQQFTQSFLAVADFNRDGHEEIVLSRDAAIYVFNSDGTLFPGAWPLQSGFIGFGAVVIGDVDGDGFPEIVTSRFDVTLGGPKILAVRRDGTIMKSWELTGPNGFSPFLYPAPALMDFDQNGTTDIAVAYQLSGGSTIPGVVTVLDTHAGFADANNDWPFMLQNQRNNPVLPRPSASSLAVTLTTGSNPSIVGDSLTFTATVTPGTATGAVMFFDGTTPVSGAIQLNNGSASFSTPGLLLGTHSITARYTGDNKLSASVSPVLIQTVTRVNASVALTLTAGTNPALVGDSLTFTASVAPASATGSVAFFDGATPISSDVPLVAGSASLTISSLPAGTHSITAQYSGDANFNAAASPALTQIVNSPKANAAITLVLSSGTNPSVFGAPLTFTARVTPASATGTVVFFDGPVAMSGNVPLVGGTASFSTSALTAGTHSITAQYGGDGSFNGAVSTALVQNVAKAPTQVDLERGESTTALKPGQPVTFIATITPASATGTVVFFDGTTAISGPIPVSNGSASFTTASLTVGSHSIRAQYSGDANYKAASSNALPVKVK
ncbi:MAG: Ig-like domain repeat protein [Acidobacteriia bacterium]|nr:Ig-like domain repeat protein [Terriglobia bacterium]